MVLAKILRRVFFKDFSWPVLLLYAFCPNDLVYSNEEAWKLYYRLAGIVILVLGFFIRYWARAYEKKDSFVLDGPYRYVRNPVELGAVAFFLGTGLILEFNILYVLLVSLSSVAFMNYASIVYETEIFLALGTIYLRYKKRVHRWIPSWLPGINKSQENLKLLRGLRQELSSYLYFIGVFLVVALRNHLQLGEIGNKILQSIGY